MVDITNKLNASREEVNNSVNESDNLLSGGVVFDQVLELGAQSTVVDVDANRFKVNTGSEVELLYLWEPSGTLPSAPFTITNITSNSFGGYDITIGATDYEFITRVNLNYRNAGNPKGWGAIGDGSDANATADTVGTQAALDFGATKLTEGHYIFNETLNVTGNGSFKSDPNVTMEFQNATGPGILVNSIAGSLSDEVLRDLFIYDNGQDRQNTHTIEVSNVNQSTFTNVNVRVGDQYAAIYGSLTPSEQLDLKFGLRVYNNSFTNFFKRCLISRGIWDIESADNHFIGNVMWGNERRYAVKIQANSGTLEGNQIIPGEEYGYWSGSPDITLWQIIDNYFDGNVQLQSVLPTGHCIWFDGNLRRSMISNNRFFIPAKESIHIDGTLESSVISDNNFSNGDSADLGFGDIYLGESNGSSVSGNSFFRNNLAEKTGAGRTQPPQPPITVNDIGSEFDEPTFVSLNSLQGVNFYADSVYPSTSGILTKTNHERISNNNIFESRYSDDEELKCFLIQPLSQPDLDDLPTGAIYTNSLVSLGIAPAGDESGYIETLRLQSSTDLSVLPFAKQEILTQGTQLVFKRTLNNGVWSAWRQI